jgi:hypothetical protein
MLRQKFAAAFLLSALLTPVLTFGQSAQTDAIGKIKDEGMNRSQAMTIMRYLTDVIGGRLTGSPSMKRANVWTRDTMTKWGLQNAVVIMGRIRARMGTEAFFRTYDRTRVPAVSRLSESLVAINTGRSYRRCDLRGRTDEAGLEKYRGKLKGAIVLTSPEREIKVGFEPDASRNTDEALRN